MHYLCTRTSRYQAQHGLTSAGFLGNRVVQPCSVVAALELGLVYTGRSIDALCHHTASLLLVLTSTQHSYVQLSNERVMWLQDKQATKNPERGNTQESSPRVKLHLTCNRYILLLSTEE